MLPSFDHAPNKIRQKKQLTKHNKQPKAYITNKQANRGYYQHW